MIKAFAAALIGAAMTTGAAFGADWKKLMSPADLRAASASGDVLVLDIRPPESGKWGPGYDGGHIPGSISAPYGAWRGPKHNPGQRMTDAALTELLQSLGVRRNKPVVVAHQGAHETDFGAAARVYWTLKSAGVKQIAILNGGVQGWWRSGGKLTDDGTAPTPSQIEAKLSDKWLATREDIAGVVTGEKKATLIDARPKDFHDGRKRHGAAKRAGTLPGSIQLTHDTWFQQSRVAIDPAESVLGRLKVAGLDKGGDKISFCNTGHWAATNWFAASELAGIDNVKLYPESMVGWANSGGELMNEPK